MKYRILFLCTHNSARSQLAQGLTNHFFGDSWEAHSAGTEKTFVKPPAIAAMAAIGADISQHESKTVETYRGETFEVVVTVCDSARETCPFFPGKKVVHRSFDDPSNEKGDDAAKLAAFARTRDEIKDWLEEFLPEMEAKLHGT
jgi:arsenate reductase